MFLSVLSVVSCRNSKLRDHYAGFVVDKEGTPISGVLVREGFTDGNKDTTDTTGYFQIKRTENVMGDLVFSKKGYQTDTVEVIWVMHGEIKMYSDLITSDTSGWVMREIIYRDSILNWSDKLRIYENDSIEMSRDGRVLYTQYLNRQQDEIIYRYYHYDGTPRREVYNTDMRLGQIHFRDFYQHDKDGIENIGYLSTFDSIPNPSNEDWSKYRYISVIKSVLGDLLLSEKYLFWESLENYAAGQYGESILRKVYNKKDNSYYITRYMEDGTIDWHYYPNGQLQSHEIYKSMYGGNFSTFDISYDSVGNKIEETNWKHLYPKWGESYNHTFSIETKREYYSNGKLKSLTKMKSFAESDVYRCGTWIYYDQKGKVLKTEKYGDCYNFELEDEYADFNFYEEGE